MMHQRIRKKRIIQSLGLLSVATLGITGCGGGEDEAGFPDGTMTLIVPSPPGGGLDTSGRQLQPYLEEAYGTSIAVENSGGGNFAIGTNQLVRAGADCSTFLINGRPLLQFSYLAQDVDYDLDDVVPIGGFTREPAVIRVGDHTGYTSLEDLLEDARQRPGEVKVSISGLTDANHLAILQLQEEEGVEFNIIPYDGGGPARDAVANGEVDWTHAGMFNSRTIESSSSVVAVQQEENLWPEVSDNAPTVNEVIDGELPDSETTYGMYVSRECYEEHPDQYEVLVEGFEEAVANEDFLATLADLNEDDKVAYVPPEEYDEQDYQAEEELAGVVDQLTEASY